MEESLFFRIYLMGAARDAGVGIIYYEKREQQQLLC